MKHLTLIREGKITYSEEHYKFDVTDIQIVMRQVESIHCQVAEYPTSEYLQNKLEFVHKELKDSKKIRIIMKP